MSDPAQQLQPALENSGHETHRSLLARRSQIRDWSSPPQAPSQGDLRGPGGSNNGSRFHLTLKKSCTTNFEYKQYPTCSASPGETVATDTGSLLWRHSVMKPRLLSIALALLPLVSVAQITTRYNNQYGQPIGSATTTGNTTYYSNQYGQPVGTANSTGGTTYYSNQFGQPLGSAISPPQVSAPPPPGPAPFAPPLIPPMPMMPALPSLPGLN